MIEKIKNWDEITEAGLQIEPGPQCCVITKIENDSTNQFIRVEFDIVKGPLKGYFKQLSDARTDKKWTGFINEFYTEKSIRFFKAFITAIEKSNKGYKWDWDETKLVGKYVIVNFREEEYVNKDKDISTWVSPFEFRSIEAYQNGKVKVEPKKCLTDEEKTSRGYIPSSPNEVASGTTSINVDDIPDDDLPF